MRQLILRGLTFTTILFLFSSMIPASAGYTAGVSAGIWVKYGDIKVNLTAVVAIRLPLALIVPPPDLPPPDWMSVTVQSVSGANITLQETGNSSSGPGWSQVFIGNVASGKGNLSLFVIPADLGKNDTIPVIPEFRINDTLTRTYAGVSRRVNMVNFTQSGGVFTFYWDRPSGMLLEVYINDTRAWISFGATGTNLPVPVAVFSGSQLLLGTLLMAISACHIAKRRQ